MLPSVSDWMSQTFDPQHSVLATLRSNYHVIALKFHKEEFQNNLWRFDFNLPLSFDRKRLDYNRPTLVDTTFTKLFLLFRLQPRLITYGSVSRQMAAPHVRMN